MSTNINYGIATPIVRLLPHLPHVVKDIQSYNLDFNALNYPSLKNSELISPLFVENLINENETFGACFPMKRKFFVDNLLEIAGVIVAPTVPLPAPAPAPAPLPAPSEDGKIIWKPVSLTGAITPVPPTPVTPTPATSSATAGPTTIGIIEKIVKELPSYYAGVLTSDPNSRVPAQIDPNLETAANLIIPVIEPYTGPRFTGTDYKEEFSPDDKTKLNDFFNLVSGNVTIPIPNVEYKNSTTPPSSQALLDAIANTLANKDEISKNGVDQTVSKNGMWWGLESNQFLTTDNMPFWVTFRNTSAPPPASEDEEKYDTLFVVSLGIDSTSNTDRYDLVISLNQKPYIVDYYTVDANTGSGKEIVRHFDQPSALLLTKDDRLDIGFMAIGGRLAIFVNGNLLLYERTHKTGSPDILGTLKECKVPKGKVRLYGTNMKSQIYAYPMTFAPFSGMSVPVANKKTVKDSSGGTQTVEVNYSSPDEKNEPTGLPTAILPVSAANSNGSVYGVDSQWFIDANGDLDVRTEIANSVGTLSTFGMQGNGVVNFFNAATLTNAPANLSSPDFFIMTMQPEARLWLGIVLPNAKTPYFYRLKGVDEEDRSQIINIPVDVTPDVMTIKETSSAPDYFHIKSSGSVSLYNEGGTYDYLKGKQFGIDVSWGWNGLSRKTFTGVITKVSNEEVAGKEVITLQFEDYNYILQHTPIINSPFYDGMVAFYAIRDLARRAGIKTFKKDWDPGGVEAYFLPSGYSFTEPKMRFKTTDKIFDCIMNVVKRFEAYIYFDASGRMIIDKLPGGLLGEPSGTTPPISERFTSNPMDTTKTLILDSKTIEFDFNSTVNQISIMTLERDTRRTILLATTTQAQGIPDILTFPKKMMIDQPAYGDIDVARSHMEDLALRVFKPIRKTSFKTVGHSSVLTPLEWITLDGLAFRLISVTRNYNAESNDFTQDYECEWLNG